MELNHQAVVLAVRKRHENIREQFFAYLAQEGFFALNEGEIGYQNAENMAMNALKDFQSNSHSRGILHAVLEHVTQYKAADWLTADSGKTIKADTVNKHKNSISTLFESVGLQGPYSEHREGTEIISHQGNPFDSVEVKNTLKGVKKQRIKAGEALRKRATPLRYLDYFLAARNTFHLRNPMIEALNERHAAEILRAKEENYSAVQLAFILQSIAFPSMCFALAQRSEFGLTCACRLGTLADIGSRIDDQSVMFYDMSGTKCFKEGLGESDRCKMLKHSGLGEWCWCHGNPQAWYLAGEDDQFSPGFCALCHFISFQTFLEDLYKADHNGESRQKALQQRENNAMPIWPHIDLNQGKIFWHTPFPVDQATMCTRVLVDWGNVYRAEMYKKNRENFTSHSNKVGVLYECQRRGVTLHEAQAISLHFELRNVALYGMEMERHDSVDLVSELQGPPLELTWNIKSRRQLQERVLASGVVMEQAKQLLPRCLDQLSNCLEKF